MVDLNVGGTTGLEPLTQLTLTEGELDRYGTLLGLQLDGLAGLGIHPQECHVVQQGILVVVNALALDGVVQGLHVRIIVIVRAVLIDRGNAQDRVIRNRGGLVQRGRHAHVAILILVHALDRNLLGHDRDLRASLNRACVQQIASVSRHGHLVAVNDDLDAVVLELVALGRGHGKCERLALRHLNRARGVGQRVLACGQGCVLNIHRNAGLDLLLLDRLPLDGRNVGLYCLFDGLHDFLSRSLLGRHFLLEDLLLSGRNLLGHGLIGNRSLGNVGIRAALIHACIGDR